MLAHALVLKIGLDAVSKQVRAFQHRLRLAAGERNVIAEADQRGLFDNERRLLTGVRDWRLVHPGVVRALEAVAVVSKEFSHEVTLAISYFELRSF